MKTKIMLQLSMQIYLELLPSLALAQLGLARFPGPGHQIKLSSFYYFRISCHRFPFTTFIWFPGPGVAKALSRVFEL